MADIEERSDSSRYIRSSAQYAARRLVVVKDEPPKGAEGLTGHSHASPSHDGAARTGRTDRFQGGCFSQCAPKGKLKIVRQVHAKVAPLNMMLVIGAISGAVSREPYT